ncbi:MAG TPA: 50S ribosomal protein L2 [Candidatus Diapherotrites archaeon]|uniref:50S ribosomal protein L2 n=1 Tax=Candidatus Iainarchaeum sp. TaxID=3101447 RepID=A0A7J4JHM6_9ARCH|nr:50S ribosomal protein L2 [Candidatus Diapherotrites archaeon]HIH16550.1 50S ribosomal protein L2 [Candidatus Diapherotrites archaeon]
MGKRTRTQRAGKGSPTYRASGRGVADVKYVDYNEPQKEGVFRAEVMDLVTDAGRTGIVAELLFEDNRRGFQVAPEGISVGQNLQYGKKAALDVGNVLPLGEIVEGCPVFNIELNPGDGGRLVKSSGLYGLIVTKDKKYVYVKLPSGKTTQLNPLCRATIGLSAGGGRVEKPLLKAGSMFHKMHASHHKYPLVRGVAMNPLDHPFGGSQHHAGKSKSTSRHAPPGRKVGAIASSRTGRKKK